MYHEQDHNQIFVSHNNDHPYVTIKYHNPHVIEQMPKIKHINMFLINIDLVQISMGIIIHKPRWNHVYNLYIYINIHRSSDPNISITYKCDVQNPSGNNPPWVSQNYTSHDGTLHNEAILNYPIV